MANTLHRIRTASVNLAARFNPPEFVDTRIDVFAYLVLLDAGGALLIDTGVGDGVAFIDETFAPERCDLRAELANHAVDVSDVRLVVNSHLHFDHSGNNRLFEKATICVHERELGAARTRGYTVRSWFDFRSAKLRALDGDEDLAHGVSTIATPGHTPGHQSVVVETADGMVLVAAQAAFTADEFRRGGDPAEQAHEGLAEDYLRSIHRLQSLSAARVCFSHDANEVAGSD